MSFQYMVRVGLGNGTRSQTVKVTANNSEDARRAAECQTRGKALGSYQLGNLTPNK